MTTKQLCSGPSILELDDENDSSTGINSDLSWQVEEEFEDQSTTQPTWSSWDDFTPDGSGGGYGFLE